MPSPRQRNDVTIYDTHSSAWWDHRDPIFTPLHRLAPARWRFFNRQLENRQLENRPLENRQPPSSRLSTQSPPASRVSLWQGLKVVDVGCGGGYMSELMARAGADVVGVDIAPGALQAAEARARAQGFSLTLHCSSAAQLPVSDGAMDVVVCTDVLVHVPDPWAVVRELGRVLKPGGLCFFSSINQTFLSRLVMITLGEDLLGLVYPGTHDPAKFLKPQALTQALAGVGITVQRLEGIGPVGYSFGEGLSFGRWPSLQVMYQGVGVKGE